jgi:hypothetical protein
VLAPTRRLLPSTTRFFGPTSRGSPIASGSKWAGRAVDRAPNELICAPQPVITEEAPVVQAARRDESAQPLSSVANPNCVVMA